MGTLRINSGYDADLTTSAGNAIHAGIDLQTLTHTINSEMLDLSDWFKATKLCLNVKKSNYVIFKPIKAKKRRI